jgi:hypothetical protein
MMGSVWEAIIAVLSAYVAVSVRLETGRSAVSMEYKMGPRILPWGTPDCMVCSAVHSS